MCDICFKKQEIDDNLLKEQIKTFKENIKLKKLSIFEKEQEFIWVQQKLKEEEYEKSYLQLKKGD